MVPQLYESDLSLSPGASLRKNRCYVMYIMAVVHQQHQTHTNVGVNTSYLHATGSWSHDLDTPLQTHYTASDTTLQIHHTTLVIHHMTSDTTPDPSHNLRHTTLQIQGYFKKT
ncbi:hypothetical protein BsWGS_23928 [Bradybaena similaris]